MLYRGGTICMGYTVTANDGICVHPCKIKDQNNNYGIKNGHGITI